MTVADKESEFRSYAYIVDRLKELGWNTKSPLRGGHVYTQNEATQQNALLKQALGRGRPEYTIALGDEKFWIIEAKRSVKDLSKALEEAKSRAKQINAMKNLSCHVITGVAGSPDTTHYVETHCLVDEQWKPLTINNKKSTGFISPEQIQMVLDSGNGSLAEYEIDDGLFIKKIGSINKILHDGAFNKRNRAGVLACILLALARDQFMQLSTDPTTLINDINNRAERELEKYNKEDFFEAIKIPIPTSQDNHIKNMRALLDSVEMLRDLNIASTINSGRDILGQCYEQFLKYANDAKEIGIVLTPRHITNFGAEIIDVKKKDIVFDPTCGTGGFLVAALDKVRKEEGDIDKFKKGNLHGIEQDQFIATLAIVNMVFRGDGSSNIRDANCLTAENIQNLKFSKVLMNPPFALTNEYEWEFVDKALEQMEQNGLLFAVLPTSTMNSATNARKEITWRQNMLQRHKLLSVIKFDVNLFYPQVTKGTYGVVIKAHRPHDVSKDKVLWAVLKDGIKRTKTQKELENNINEIQQAVKSYFAVGIEPEYKPEELDCSLIELDENLDLSPELHIGQKQKVGTFDIHAVKERVSEANKFIRQPTSTLRTVKQCNLFTLNKFFDRIEKGKSGRAKQLKSGELPLISTAETRNGISEMVDKNEVKKIYNTGNITISSNGGSCRAHYHNYEFAANGDVFVCSLKEDFNDEVFAQFLCSAINGEAWRFDYCRKLSQEKLDTLAIRLPIGQNGAIDFDAIKNLVNDF